MSDFADEVIFRRWQGQQRLGALELGCSHLGRHGLRVFCSQVVGSTLQGGLIDHLSDLLELSGVIHHIQPRLFTLGRVRVIDKLTLGCLGLDNGVDQTCSETDSGIHMYVGVVRFLTGAVLLIVWGLTRV